ncbi:hypothetical protein EDC56_2557 [Sinobacterium caligoides]|uniref:Uncharacterized protein n=1 Tax=Sinobacterium caligoides TaxID=933926 RepID=A0A3N2DJF8_9GAMM|nr:hypothetical protein EDC56_2557 [Sinobacterium caligoides]
MESCDLTAVITLSNTLTELFSFDPAMFAAVLSGCIVTFISGHVTGKVIRLMSRS